MTNPNVPAPATKSGWKTSEFWISLLGIIGTTVQAMSPNSNNATMIGTGLATGAYALSRAHVKANS